MVKRVTAEQLMELYYFTGGGISGCFTFLALASVGIVLLYAELPLQNLNDSISRAHQFTPLPSTRNQQRLQQS